MPAAVGFNCLRRYFFALLAGACHFIGKEVQLVAFEVVVVEDATLRLIVGDQFVETVHVQLSDEGEKIVVLEVLWEDFSGEPVNIFDDKGLSVWSPANDVFILFILSKGPFTSTIL